MKNEELTKYRKLLSEKEELLKRLNDINLELYVLEEKAHEQLIEEIEEFDGKNDDEWYEDNTEEEF